MFKSFVKFMASIPSVAELTRRLNAAKAREAALKARQQANTGENVGKGQPRPSESVKYKSIFTAQDFLILAPSAGIQFFGGLAALGLAAPDASPGIPRGFQPAKIKATIGRTDNKGVPKTATLSQRQYMKYTVDATAAGTRGSYSAPVSADTVASLKTKVQAVMTAKKDDVKEYGRIWFEPERPIFTTSGDAAAAT